MFKNTTRASFFLIFFAASAVLAQMSVGDEAHRARRQCVEDLVRALADDTMEGRGVGTAGLERAGVLVADEMADIGLEPLGLDYRQPFDVLTGMALGPLNRLHATGGDAAADYLVGEEFTPLGFSDSGAFDGQLAFVGYGISADSLGYDDYAAVDVTGRVVLAMRFEPGEHDEDSPFDGRRPSRYSDLHHKAMFAREAGAAALIVVTPPAPDDDGPEDAPDQHLLSLRADGPVSDAGIPVLQVTPDLADAWLGIQGLSLRQLVAEIDTDAEPHSRLIDAVVVSGRVDLVPSTTAVFNVVGMLPGQGSLANEAVVIGAHYDHLGFGGNGSMAPDSGEIHNGADDNASGVAAMLCATRDFAVARPTDHRTLIVIGFSAEEVGLRGSAFYVDNPLRPLEQTVAMVNLDMVGRIRDHRLSVLGTDTAPEWATWFAPLGDETGLELQLGGDGYGPSDHAEFYRERIPVVHLFSGGHDEYHTPADDVETLNFDGTAQVVALTRGLLQAVTTAEPPPSYQPPSSTPLMSGDSRGYGAYLGTIPDYTAMNAREGGVLLSAVREGGPADRAGIAGGDRIVRMGEVSIENLYDMTFVLQDHRPGEVLEIVVDRLGSELTFAAVLGRRGAPTETENSVVSPHTDPHGQPHPTVPAERQRPSDEGDSSPNRGASQEQSVPWVPTAGVDATHLLDPRETHLSALRQLTFGGENAEGYFAPDGRSVIFQATTEAGACDQQFVLDLSTGEVTRVSSGLGRTTCGFFAYPDGEALIYATTEAEGAACPPPVDQSQGYVWPLHSFDLVWQTSASSEPRPFLPSAGYDAEATACMVDGRLVFTSTRNGDLDLYSVDPDGENLRQLTNTAGYDGGAFYTPDCTEIVWRASRPEGEALAEYQRLLESDLVRPSQLEIMIMNADGTRVRQLTDNGAANFGPYPTPDASGVIFASNMGGSPREFDLWLVSRDGGDPEQITFTEQFDGFPMFSPDGQWLVFASNRGGTDNETNLFIARWR